MSVVNLGIGWAVALLVATVALVIARLYLVRKQTGRVLPYFLAVLAGVFAVALVATIVGLIVLR